MTWGSPSGLAASARSVGGSFGQGGLCGLIWSDFISNTDCLSEK